MVDFGIKYNTLFEFATIGLSIVDSERNIFKSNKTLETIYRLSEEDLLKGVFKTRMYIHSDGSELSADEFPSTIALRENHVVNGVEIGVKLENGEIIWTEVSAAPLEDNGEFALVMTQEKTDRKKIKLQFQESEAIWRQLVSTIPDYIALHDVDGTYLFLNHYADGFTENDIVGKSLFDFISVESKEVFSTNLTACINTKQPQQFNYSAFGNDKVMRFYEGQIVPILENGKLINILSIAKDITDRKRAEEELKNALQWHLAIFEGSRDSVFITDIDSRFVAVNAAACKLTGYSREELLNMRIPDLHEPGDLKAYNKYHKRILDGEEILTETIILRKDRSRTVTELNNRCVCVGEIRYIHTTARDISERKQIEADLHLRSEIVKNITQGVNLVSLEDENIIFTNRRFDEMFGYESGELIGRNISIVNAPSEKSPDETKQEIISILKCTGEWHGEILNKKKNGEIFWTHADVSMFDHTDFGKVLITTQSDITERVMIEKALSESEAKFRTLFENSHIGISAASTDGRLIQANNAFARMYGYENSDLMISTVKNVKDLYASPSKRDELLKILRKDGVIEEMEVEVIRRDGSHFFVLVSARDVRDKDGTLLYSDGTHFDLTERKKIEEKIREASLYTRSLIEASVDPLMTINNNGKITDVNLATEKITGIKRKKLIGSDFSDYFSEPEKAKEGYKTVFKTGKVKDYPLTILHSEGRKIDVFYNASIYRNEVGEVQGVFAAARDITNSKKLEDELRKSRQLLRKLNQHLLVVRENERNQIGLSLHDDLGQRLTGLYLDIEWLKRRIGVQSAVVNKKFKELIFMINETIENVKKISSFLRPSILYELGLIPAIRSHIKKFEEQSGIKCHFTCLPEKILVNDQVALILYRIIMESFTNIARHSEASNARVRLRTINDKIELIVKDDGIGISNEEISSMKSMGLEGMRERIDAVGGRFQISGKRGSGTIIKVLIPIIDKPAND